MAASIPPSSDVLCESERAIERLGNMRTLYANVVGRFLDDTAGNFAKLRRAIAHGDMTAVHQAAHSLKGVAAMCGATRVEMTLAELELATAQSDTAPVDELSQRLEQEMTATRAILNPFRQTTG